MEYEAPIQAETRMKNIPKTSLFKTAWILAGNKMSWNKCQLI